MVGRYVACVSIPESPSWEWDSSGASCSTDKQTPRALGSFWAGRRRRVGGHHFQVTYATLLKCGILPREVHACSRQLPAVPGRSLAAETAEPKWKKLTQHKQLNCRTSILWIYPDFSYHIDIDVAIKIKYFSMTVSEANKKLYTHSNFIMPLIWVHACEQCSVSKVGGKADGVIVVRVLDNA